MSRRRKIFYALTVSCLSLLLMAQVTGFKLSALPSASSVADADMLYLVQSGASKSVTVAILLRDATASVKGVLQLAGDLTGTAASPAIAANAVALSTDTTGDYVSGVTAAGGLTKTGTEGATLGLNDCAA